MHTSSSRLITIAAVIIFLFQQYSIVADGPTAPESTEIISAPPAASETTFTGEVPAARGTGSRTELDILINEIMLFPNEGGPWVEIYNSGEEHFPIDHWLLSDEDGLNYEIELPQAVPPKNYAVIHFESGDSEKEYGQSQPNAIHLYTGWKNVRWTAHEVDPFTHYIRAAAGYDIIPGGKPEILANYFGGDRILIYEPMGDMTQWWLKSQINTIPPVDYQSYRIVPTDVDADGLTDLVFDYYFGNDNGGNSIQWLKQPVTGPKNDWNGPYPIAKLYRPEGLSAGNISGDNLTDIVAASETDDDIYWYRCPPDPTIDTWTRYEIDKNFNAPGGLWLTDIDLDGDTDCVAVGSYGDEVAWYERPADPTGAWTKHKIYKSTRSRGSEEYAGNNASARSTTRNEFDPIGEIFLNDLDMDGRLDIIVTEPKNNRVVWYQSPPDPTDSNQIWFSHVIDDNLTSPSGLDVGDFDGDGFPDIAATSTAGSIVWYVHPTVWDIQKTNWERYIVDDSVHLAFYVNATDFDGDGDLDLVTADQNDGKIIWYENDIVSFSAADQCSLYREADTLPETIIDFVAWGMPAGGEDNNAVMHGIWDVNSFVPTTELGYNKTIARDRFSTDSNTIGDWEASCGIHSDIPTSGTVNYPKPTNSKPVFFYNPVIFSGGLGPEPEPPLNVPDGVILANYSSYTFSVNVTNPFGADDIESVEFTLDPGGANIALSWNRSDNRFNVQDKDGYIIFIPEESSAETDDIYNWQVNFTIVVNWHYPDRAPNDISVSSRNAHNFGDNDIIPSFYRVETGLNLTGNLKILKKEDGSPLYTNDWVLPGTELTVSGTKVVYDLPGYEFYPAESDFNVVLEDSLGNRWFDFTSSGYEIKIDCAVPPNAETGSYKLTARLTNLTAGAVAIREVTDMLTVDSNNVFFDKPSPGHHVWNTKRELVCSIRISDLQPESSVLGSSISYRLANGSTERYGAWNNAPLFGTGEVMEPAVTYVFPEGADNWIQWRASDKAGNGPTESEWFRIPVDTKNITFHEFYPPEAFVLSDKNATIRITAADFGGSGVNTSSIRASIKPAGESSFGDWFDLEFVIVNQTVPSTDSVPSGPESVVLEAKIWEFGNGTNYIRFRGLDFAGNGFAESREYRVNIDVEITKLSLDLVEPKNGSIVRSLFPVLKWQPGVPVIFNRLDYRIYISENRTRLESLSSTNLFNPVASSATIESSMLEIGLDSLPELELRDNTRYFWTVIPYYDLGTTHEIAGICKSGIWEFKIFVSKSGLEFDVEPESIQFYAGNSATVSIKIRNLGLSSDNYSFSFKPEGGLAFKFSKPFLFLKSGNAGTVNLTISAFDEHEGGEYRIKVYAYSMSTPDKESADLDIKIIAKKGSEKPGEEKNEADVSSYGSFIVLLIIVLISAIITIFNYMYSRKRQKPPKQTALEKSQPIEIQQIPVKSRPLVEIPPQENQISPEKTK